MNGTGNIFDGVTQDLLRVLAASDVRLTFGEWCGRAQVPRREGMSAVEMLRASRMVVGLRPCYLKQTPREGGLLTSEFGLTRFGLYTANRKNLTTRTDLPYWHWDAAPHSALAG